MNKKIIQIKELLDGYDASCKKIKIPNCKKIKISKMMNAGMEIESRLEGIRELFNITKRLADYGIGFDTPNAMSKFLAKHQEQNLGFHVNQFGRPGGFRLFGYRKLEGYNECLVDIDSGRWFSIAKSDVSYDMLDFVEKYCDVPFIYEKMLSMNHDLNDFIDLVKNETLKLIKKDVNKSKSL